MNQILCQCKSLVMLLAVHLLFLAGAGQAYTTSRANITATGRNIQMDGFLLEWKTENARIFAGDGRLLWDASNTAEGFAGYVKMVMTDSCRPSALIICAGNGNCVDVSLQRDSIQTAAVVMFAVAGDSLRKTAEFLIPWKGLAAVANDSGLVKMRAVSECGDTIGEIICKGKPLTPEKTTVLTPTLKFQIAFIVILLIAYLVLMMRIRKIKTTRRKEWPRQ
jgi:hypothetical protein